MRIMAQQTGFNKVVSDEFGFFISHANRSEHCLAQRA
jgi:hypothetical protein